MVDSAPSSMGRNVRNALPIACSQPICYDHDRKPKGDTFKVNANHLKRTLDGMEKWLLKNESNFSAGDLTALSSDRKDFEEDSPLEQLLNCALQVYHWGRTHGELDSAEWGDNPSDVRKAFNSAILELGSDGEGKPNFKSQRDLILRMRRNHLCSSLGTPTGVAPQGHSIQEDTGTYKQTISNIPLPTCAKPRSPLTSVTEGGASKNPFSLSVVRRVFSPPSKPSLLPKPSKSSSGKFWDIVDSSTAHPGSQTPTEWNTIKEDNTQNKSSIPPAVINQSCKPKLHEEGGSPKVYGLIDLSCPSSPSSRINLSSENNFSMLPTEWAKSSMLRAVQHSASETPSQEVADDDEDEDLGKISAIALYVAYGQRHVQRGPNINLSAGDHDSSSNSASGFRSGSESCGSSPENSPSSGSGQMNRGKKHGREASDDDQDGKDSEPPKRKKKLMSAQEINQRLACPFAKADPTRYSKCIFIHRRDLPGVRLVLLNLSKISKATTPLL
ncbi:hypothetical protein TWF481_010795 [Arthrobotrys musiformis]|uniref:Uncharacterized protein n=1 Tax=Arthrobotrys musiformis TaxID=47236 RepID=A0AAV9W200_9PEZI